MDLRRMLGLAAVVVVAAACGTVDGDADPRVGASGGRTASSTAPEPDPAAPLSAPTELDTSWGTVVVAPLPGLEALEEAEEAEEAAPSAPDERRISQVVSEELSPPTYESASQSYIVADLPDDAPFAVAVTIFLGPGTTADLVGDERMVPAGEHEGRALFARTARAPDVPELPDDHPVNVEMYWTSLVHEVAPGALLWIGVDGPDLEVARSYLDFIEFVAST